MLSVKRNTAFRYFFHFFRLEQCERVRNVGEGTVFSKHFLTKTALTFAGLKLSDTTG